jgi:hypothetical protein
MKASDTPKIIKNKQSLDKFIKTKKDVKFVDAYSSAINELFFVQNPKLKKESPDAKILLLDFLKKNIIRSHWIYFPWSNSLVKTVPEEIYYTLRTARNKEIITKKEQDNFRKISVSIVGLSVGSEVLAALTKSGGPKKIKIADFDTVEITNLNRIRAHLSDVGTNKTVIAAREVWGLDPYAELELWEKGVSHENLEKFITDNSKPSVFIDEMDNISLKILSRIMARKNRIPTIMATDNGDSVVLDIERFDLESNRKIFHGLIGDIKTEEIKTIDYKKWLKLATQIVGPEYLPLSMQRSLLNIGKTISSVPQLGTTASMAGAAIAFAIRKIANNESMPSGRYVINLEEKIEPNYNSTKETKKRERNKEFFIRNFGK